MNTYSNLRESNMRAKPEAVLIYYSAKNVDNEIQHLEHVLTGDAVDSMFGRTYWRDRVIDAAATPDLVPSQRARLERLLARLPESLGGFDGATQALGPAGTACFAHG
ncbi:hypothetical protein [Caballeronia grimmiae]|uniref:hypothetical protein n=1 Tax=Caballeronia grimmiae TaxID=1071679 RepID=UPI0038BCC563